MIRLEAPQISGCNAVAALVEQILDVQGGDDAVWAHGSLEPRAFLCEIDGVEEAFSGNGRPLTDAEVDTLLPGAWAKFRIAVALARRAQSEGFG